MQYCSDLNTYTRYFATLKVMEKTQYIFAFVGERTPEKDKDITDEDLLKALLGSFEPYLWYSNLDEKVFSSLLLTIVHERTTSIVASLDEKKVNSDLLARLTTLRERTRNTEAFDSLLRFIRFHAHELAGGIESIPNSFDKACGLLLGLIEVALLNPKLIDPYQVYDAMAFLSDEIVEKEVDQIRDMWLQDDAENRKYRMGIGPFWLARTGYEVPDALSHHLFREEFGLDILPDKFEEMESDLETLLTESTDVLFPLLGCRASFDPAILLWHISRSESLSRKLEDAIHIAIRRLTKGQMPEAWPRYYEAITAEQPDPAEVARYALLDSAHRSPSITVMALISLAILRLDKQLQFAESALSGAKWLIQHQNSDGSWNTEAYCGNRDELGVKPDLLTTLLSVEALLRSDLPESKAAIQAGWSWILSQQNALGGWDSELVGDMKEWLPFPLNTVLVLELDQLLRNPPLGRPSIFLSYSRIDWSEFAESLAHRLREAGYNVWVDQHLLRTGQNWLDDINAALRICDYMVLCLSPSSVTSKWVKMEYRFFLDEHKPIFPVLCRKVVDIPAELREIQRTEFEAFAALVEAIRLTHLAGR